MNIKVTTTISMSARYSTPHPVTVNGLRTYGAGGAFTPGGPSPPVIFAGTPIMGGSVSNGPGIASVPGISGVPGSSPSTLYNGGTPGNRSAGMPYGAQFSVKTAYVIVNDAKMDPNGDYVRSLSEGMFLFGASDGNRGAHSDSTRSSQAIANPPIVNATKSYGKKLNVFYDINGVNRALEAYIEEYSKLTDAQDVLAMWRPIGVFKNEGAPDRRGIDAVKSLSRLVNVVTAHRAKTFNIWGGDIRNGTKLFFICKKVLRKTDEKSVQKVWTIYPFADRLHEVPPLSELMYEDDEGVMRVGAYCRVGFSVQNETSYTISSKDDREKATKKLRDMMNPVMSGVGMRVLKDFEIYIGC